jgi:hypothetical protein
MRNKQKAWRRLAQGVKAQVVKAGGHEHGMRYGRQIKAVMIRTKAPVSELFYKMLLNLRIVA